MHTVATDVSVPSPPTRRALLTTVGKLAYAAPALVVLAANPATAFGASGPGAKGNNGFGQEKHGASKDAPPAGKLKNDKPGPR